MKILFDHEIFYQQKYGGVSNYFFHLINGLIDKKISLKICSPIYKNYYLNNLPKKFVYGFYLEKYPYFANSFIKNINNFFSQRFVRHFKPQIVHQTYYSNDVYSNYNVKKICTVYDMINEKFPSYFNNSNLISQIKRTTILNADHLICISQKTKEDLINFYKIKEDKISVILLASSYKIKRNILKKKLFKNCLLFVGSRHGYKNFKNFIKAYSHSSFLKNNFKIIIYGGEKIGEQDFKIFKKYNIDLAKLIFLNDKSYDLKFVYQNVSALIYPSLYEGFGLPLLEAMSLGCPVISSNAGSLMEVGGEGLKYFNPFEFESIIETIESVLNSEKNTNNLIEYGYQRAKSFSWSKCATETARVYKNIL